MNSTNSERRVQGGLVWGKEQEVSHTGNWLNRQEVDQGKKGRAVYRKSEKKDSEMGGG